MLQLLGEFSENILSGEQQLPELEQLNAAAEALASQMVTPTKTTGIRAANAGLTASVKINVNDATHGSQISTSANKIILSSPASGRIDAPMKNQTMLTLPLDEPDTLNLPQINIRNSNNGPISPVPDTTTIFLASDKISGSKSTFDDSQYITDVSDFYGTWNTEPLDVDIELFPELF